MNNRRVMLISSVGTSGGWVPVGISRLKAFLAAGGTHVDNLYLGPVFTKYLATSYPDLLDVDETIGEWGYSFHEYYFAGKYFNHAQPEKIVRECIEDWIGNRDVYHQRLNCKELDHFGETEARLKREYARALEYCKTLENWMEETLSLYQWSNYDVVGFSCLSAQFLTSCYLARRIRALADSTPLIVFGGGMFEKWNMTDVVELFPEVDLLVVGEGEVPLLKIVESVGDQERLRSISGTVSKTEGLPKVNLPIPSPPAGELPIPNYDEVAGIVATTDRFRITPWASFGCSWSRCSFCAITTQGYNYREPQAIFNEIVALANNYGTSSFVFGDWEVNGAPKKLEALCELIIESGYDFDFWAECNARNTSLTLLRKMVRAGFRDIQIGIESFSNSLLKKMAKPATVIDNIKAIKWASEAGARQVLFNLLIDHPGTDDRDLEETLEVLRLIPHLLMPPCSFLPIKEFELHRSAPLGRELAISSPESYQVDLRCYPDDLGRRLRYFLIRHKLEPIRRGWEVVQSLIDDALDQEPQLNMSIQRDLIRIVDTRMSEPKVILLRELERDIYCNISEDVLRPDQIASQLNRPLAEVNSVLSSLKERRLVYEEQGHYLGLALRGFP